MEERTQEYMCGGNLHAMPPVWVQCAESEEREYWQHLREAQPEVDVAPFPGFDAYNAAVRKYALVQRENEELRAEVKRYKDWHVAYTAGIDDKILGLQEAFARQQEETEKWRQLYSVSRHQASRALDMLHSAKVQIEVLENKLNGRQ